MIIFVKNFMRNSKIFLQNVIKINDKEKSQLSLNKNKFNRIKNKILYKSTSREKIS
jgi:hypothetical protein